MRNLSDGITAVQYVKNRLTLNNRHVRQDRSNKPAQQRQDDQAHLRTIFDTQLRNHPTFPTMGATTLLNVVLYGTHALATGYGNCLEMACACAWHLNNQGRFFYDLAYYPTRGDHVFLVIGQQTDDNGDFPTDFAQWHADAVICDAWADIACPAVEYPTRWRARMHNWQIMGWSLASHLPTGGLWFDLVDHPKRSYFSPVVPV